MVKTIEQIKELIDQGKLAEADLSIEALLKLGPTNVGALKLKALIFSQQGYFNAEHCTWCRIMEITPDDLDVMNYFNFYYLEEKEKFYFTDRMPEGGRRFLLYPKMLFEACGAGFFSCIFFLLIHEGLSLSLLGQVPFISYALLFLFVVVPWFFIIRAFLTMPGDLRVTFDGIKVSNRFKEKSISWQKISKIYVAHTSKKHAFSLSLILIPTDPQKKTIEIEISLDKSIVKGRRFLLQEILIFYKKVEYIQRDKINLPSKNSLFSF